MSYDTVMWEEADGIGRLTLNRPETINAWTAQLGSELKHIIEGEAAADSVRVVLISGSGRGFSSGADLKAGFDPAEDGMPNIRKELHEVYHPAIAGIRRLPKPVVAAVHGAAVGIGCSLALACDLVMAGETAFFGLAFVNIGLMPDGGSTAFVPPAVGKARAFQMALMGERVPAPQALEWGLVNWVYPRRPADGASRGAGQPSGRKVRLARTRAPSRLSTSSSTATSTRSFISKGELQHALGRSKDFLEGVAAFVAKREPCVHRPVGPGTLSMAYTAAEGRPSCSRTLARADQPAAASVASLGEAYELLDEGRGRSARGAAVSPRSARLRPRDAHLQRVRHASPGHRPPAWSGVQRRPQRGPTAYVQRAIEALEQADTILGELQDSMLPVEVGDRELREGLAGVRELIARRPVTDASCFPTSAAEPPLLVPFVGRLLLLPGALGADAQLLGRPVGRRK